MVNMLTAHDGKVKRASFRLSVGGHGDDMYASEEQCPTLSSAL